MGEGGKRDQRRRKSTTTMKGVSSLHRGFFCASTNELVQNQVVLLRVSLLFGGRGQKSLSPEEVQAVACSHSGSHGGHCHHRRPAAVGSSGLSCHPFLLLIQRFFYVLSEALVSLETYYGNIFAFFIYYQILYMQTFLVKTGTEQVTKN